MPAYEIPPVLRGDYYSMQINMSLLILALDVLVDALGAGLACAHGKNDSGGAGDSVAAGENAFLGGAAALVGLNAALAGEGEALSGVADQGVGAGADGDDDSVNIQDPLGAGYCNTTKGLNFTKKGGIEADEGGCTSREGVFAGGDAVTGAATVILAMGAGKLGAKSIDEYLSAK